MPDILRFARHCLANWEELKDVPYYDEDGVLTDEELDEHFRNGVSIL